MHPIIYQLSLRVFTPEGTIAAATKLLPHIASLDVDIVYVCPFFVQENDENREFWSVRQIASETNNPKNPYKIADYFHVDEEYGTDEDLKRFVDEAHRLGLKVMFDLVYLHCGRQAVFISEHPDFVERNEDGSVKVPDRWPFARLNFENPALREYLISNMLYLVTEYAVDGFRCDVGDSVPLDFWKEAFARVRTVKPDLIALNEGARPAHIAAFDLGYSFQWHRVMRKILAEGASAATLAEFHALETEKYGKDIHKMARMPDNHDFASDVGLLRNEIVMTTDGVEALLVVAYTFEGFPFLWNGYELCDDAENCMFSNRDYGRRSAMDWSKAFTENGKRRMRFLKKLHWFYHNCKAFSEGALTFVPVSDPDAVIAYTKVYGEERVLVVVNAKPRATSVTLEAPWDGGTVLLSHGARRTKGKISLAPYGYTVLKL